MTLKRFTVLVLAISPTAALAKNSQAETMFGLAMALVLGLVTFIALSKTDRKLNDPNDSEIIFTDQILEQANLRPAKQYTIHIYRQSGNPQQPDRIVEAEGGFDVPPAEAIKLALTTLRRAKIDHVSLLENTETTLHVQRPLHQHGGKQEGKKVRGAIIKASEV